jgi:hypothetical protein
MVDFPAPLVYQLRVVLRGISPLIWRRLLVRADSTIVDLHQTLQIAFGWSDTHLHRFVIHGKDYGVAHLGGRIFADDPTQVRLANLRLRPRERFGYEYDFGDLWQHDLRVEQIMEVEPRRTYPVCIGGARAAPPEDCGGPWAFLELRHHHHPVRIAGRLAAIFSALFDAADPDAVIDQYRQELAELVRWAAIDRFDRRHVNRRFAWYVAADERWWSQPEPAPRPVSPTSSRGRNQL